MITRLHSSQTSRYATRINTQFHKNLLRITDNFDKIPKGRVKRKVDRLLSHPKFINNVKKGVKDSSMTLCLVKQGKVLDGKEVKEEGKFRRKKDRDVIGMLRRQERGHSRAVSAFPFEVRGERGERRVDGDFSLLLVRGNHKGENSTQKNFKKKFLMNQIHKRVKSNNISGNFDRVQNLNKSNITNMGWNLNKLNILSQCEIDWNTNPLQ